MSTDTFGPRRIYVESRHRILADTSPAYRDSLVHPTRQRLLAYYAACDPSGTPLALADVESMTLRIRASRDAAEVLAEKVVLAADLDLTPTLNEWTAGTDAHAIFDLSAAELNLTLGGPTRRMWVTVQALIDDGVSTPYTLLLLADYVELWEDGSSAADPPPENPGTAATLDDVEALLNERQLPTGGDTGNVLRKASDDDFDTEWGPAGSGSGDVVGPASAVSGNLPSYDGTTGKLLDDSGIAAADVIQEGDARLTDARTPLSHTHGGISNAGAIGVTSGLPIKTGASGVLEVGAFGTGAGTFAEGNDSRLSDARTPTAHASTHVTGGVDKIRDATAAQDGLMTSAYAGKLDGIATNANNYVHPNHSGDVTSVGDGATTIANDAVTFAKMQNIGATSLIGRHSSGSGDPEQVGVGGGIEFQGANIRRAALTGDVTASAGDNSTTIANDTVTNAKLANMAEATIKGRQAASGTGDPEDLTATQARTILNVADGANAYTHPNHSGDVTSVGDGTQTIAATAISGKATETPLAGTEEVLINVGGTLKKTTTQGIADLGGGGGGDISGTVGAVDNTIPRADGAGGDTLQGSALTIPDATTATQANVGIANVHDGQTNSALRLQPKGTGALILGPAPDGTAAGGNARGNYAVDLDVQRAAAAEVASGNNSFKGGNVSATASGVPSAALANTANSKASGARSFAAASNAGEASGNHSVMLGCDSNATASGYRSIIAASEGGTASGSSSGVIACFSGTSSGANGFCAGASLAAASSDQTIAMGGFGANAHLANMHAQGGTDWDSNGTTRNGGSLNLRWFGSTTNATQTELGIYRASFRRAILRTHESWSGILTVQGLRSGSADWGSQHFQVHITRDGTTVSAAINQLGTEMGSNSGVLPTGWAIDVDADTTNHALRVRVTGVAAQTIRWVAYFNGGLIRHDD
jgi:hypothetical protein